jgi:hypothetical protein
MIEEYLTGSIRQSLERIRQLRGIVQARYPREYDGLRQNCLNKLDLSASELNALLKERIVDTKLQTPRRVRAFKRTVEHVNGIEGIGVFALNRANAEDEFLNRLITDVCKEISYPLITPVISQMSQDYFHIYPDFNLLCLPLIESRFLLHLPDIYHELCHPLHRNLDLPVLEPYQKAYKQSLFGMVRLYQGEINSADRLGNQQARIFQLQLWRNCWTKYWMEEFFCDLFGVLAAGPAFAWSHYHLCVKRGGDPFHTPLMFETTHPADDARMRGLLQMLRTNKAFAKDADALEAAWREFLETMGYRAPPEYLHCYSDKLISAVVAHAKTGVEGINVTVAGSGKPAAIRDLLNSAWATFWKIPGAYQTWETKQISDLRSTVSV